MMADTPRLRLSVVGIVTLSLFAALFARLYYLQVLDHESYRVAAESNQVRVVREPAPRGRILDRQGRVLVDNRPSTIVTVDRTELRRLRPPDRQVLLARLARVLGEPVATLEERLADVRVSPVVPVPIARDVGQDVVTALREHHEDYPGVAVRQVAVRVYPHGSLAAHVVGYTGEINAEELEARADGDYRMGDAIGKAGVELIYEEELRGRPGLLKLEVDSRGRTLGPLGERAPVQGRDVRLTIDIDVQRLAEESLAQALESARTRRYLPDRTFFEAPAGAVVVLDVSDGSVVAMASHPTYDPTQFVGGISQDAFAELIDPQNHSPFTNRAIQGQYPPGSTFKLVTAVAAMRSGLINANTTVLDGGRYTIPNCRGEACVRRNAGGRAHGRVDLARALVVSSNVFFYGLGADFWIQRGTYGDALQAAARDLGMGEPSGVPLPAEGSGSVLDPESFRARHDANPRAFPRGQWLTGDSVNMAIGEGDLLVTPLQLANAFATFANGGTVRAPGVANAVLTQDGRIVRELQPRVARTVELPGHVRDPILRGLLGVTASREGTAVNAFAGFPLQQYAVAGKTGTGQVSRRQDNALFAAFAPAGEPRYAIAVVMEQSGFGASAAAPVARRLFGHLSGLEADEDEPVEVVAGVAD